MLTSSCKMFLVLKMNIEGFIKQNCKRNTPTSTDCLKKGEIYEFQSRNSINKYSCAYVGIS